MKKILFLNFSGWQWGGFVVSPLNNSLASVELEEVATEYSPLDFSQLNNWNGFYDAKSLREVRIINCRINPNFRKSDKISLESLTYLVEHAYKGASFNIIVHADVYAKLTGDTTNAAAAALSADELAQWQQLLADAAAKNISFATA